MASGILSFAACHAVQGLGAQLGAGLIFGLLVLAPGAASVAAGGLCVAASTAVYRGAVALADALHTGLLWRGEVACGLAGLLGALALAAAVLPLLRIPVRPAGVALGTACGAAAGVLIGRAIETPEERWLPQQLLLLAGFVSWQLAFSWAHRLRGGGVP